MKGNEEGHEDEKKKRMTKDGINIFTIQWSKTFTLKKKNVTQEKEDWKAEIIVLEGLP